MDTVGRTAEEEEEAGFPSARNALAAAIESYLPDRLLLLIGSRWFERPDAPRVAVAAAIATLRTTMYEASYFDPRNTLIVSGGAVGIDRWSVQIGAEMGMKTIEFRSPSGRTVVNGHAGGRWVEADLSVMTPRDAFLFRDRAVAHVVSVARRMRHTIMSVSARAIVAEASQTRGTDYTVGRLDQEISSRTYVVSASGSVRLR